MTGHAEVELFAACCEDRVEDVRKLLRGGADPNKRHESGLTPLWVACAIGNEKTVAALVAFGTDLEGLSAWKFCDTKKWPHPLIEKAGTECASEDVALMVAVDRSRGSIVELLIRAGANPHHGNVAGISPFVYAGGHEPLMLKRMLDLGVDPHVEGKKALSNATMWATGECVKLLVGVGIIPDAVVVGCRSGDGMVELLRSLCPPGTRFTAHLMCGPDHPHSGTVEQRWAGGFQTVVC